MDVSLLFNSSNEFISLLKLSILYYNRTNILCSEHENIKYYNLEVFNKLKTFTQNDFVTLQTLDVAKPEIFHGLDGLSIEILRELFKGTFLTLMYETYNRVPDMVLKSLAPIFAENKKYFFELGKFVFTDKQIITDYQNIQNQVEPYLKSDIFGDDVKPEQIQKIAGDDFLFNTGVSNYFFSMIILLAREICSGHNCISNNDFLNKWLATSNANNNITITNSANAHNDLIFSETVPIFLPNFFQMHFEDIIELRYLARNELEEMRYFINLLSHEYSPQDKNNIDMKVFIKNKINPSIKRLENKVYDLRIGTIKNALQNLKNPLTYTPMLTSFFVNIPPNVALAVSMGLVTAETIVDYIARKNELKSDPLFFSIKLKNIVKRKFGL